MFRNYICTQQRLALGTVSGIMDAKFEKNKYTTMISVLKLTAYQKSFFTLVPLLTSVFRK
jgi:hypothetical protein